MALGLGDGVDEFREVEFGSVSSKPEGGFVIGSGGGLRGVKGAEPDPGGFVWVANLRGPFAPRTLPDSPVSSLSLASGFVGG